MEHEVADNLPAFLDPLLDYLSTVLPSPLVTFIESLISHSLSLFTALYSLVIRLASSSPSTWDAQTIIPPLISCLAAYLALVSLYRTTSWMIRTSIWVAKWGTIFGALLGGLGYFLGANGGGNAAVGAPGLVGGIIPTLSAFILDMINGHDRNAAGGSRARARQRQRPAAWETFDRHREWQYEEGGAEDDSADGEGGNSDARKIMGQIVGFAGKMMRDAGWLDTVRNAVNNVGEELQGEDGAGRRQREGEGDAPAAGRGGTGRRKQPPRKAKTRAGSSRPR